MSPTLHALVRFWWIVAAGVVAGGGGGGRSRHAAAFPALHGLRERARHQPLRAVPADGADRDREDEAARGLDDRDGHAGARERGEPLPAADPVRGGREAARVALRPGAGHAHRRRARLVDEHLRRLPSVAAARDHRQGLRPQARRRRRSSPSTPSRRSTSGSVRRQKASGIPASQRIAVERLGVRIRSTGGSSAGLPLFAGFIVLLGFCGLAVVADRLRPRRSEPVEESAPARPHRHVA